MEINTISSFNHDQRARVQDNVKVGAGLGAVAGAVLTQRAMQKAFENKGYMDTFVNNVKDFATAKTTKDTLTEKIKGSKINLKDLAKKAVNSKFARGGAIGLGLVAGTALVSAIAARVAKDSTELKIAKEVLD